MTALASSDITVTILERRNYGRQRQNLVKLVFGDSSKTYPTNGVPLPSSTTLGLKFPYSFVELIGDVSAGGLEWQWDYTNSTLRAYSRGHIPPVVIEEAVTLTSNAGTLKYLPAHIICAVGTISATVTPLRPVPHTATLATKEMGVNWTTGAITTKSTDSVTSCAVSYIPQQPSGPFSQANMVINETVAAVTGNVNLAYQAAAIEYLYQTTATAARLAISHANASGVVAVDIVNSSNTTISFNSAQNSKSVSVTYLKRAGFLNDIPYLAIDQASISLSSEAREWGKTAGDYVGGLYVPAFAGQVVGKEASNYLSIYLGDSTATAAAGTAKFEIAKDKITTAETTPQTSIEDTPLLFLSSLYATANTFRAELTTNDAPVATTLYALVTA